MRNIVVAILFLFPKPLTAQHQRMEFAEDPFLFRDPSRNFTLSPETPKKEDTHAPDDTTGLFESLFSELDPSPLLRITTPGSYEGYPTIVSIEETGAHFYLLKRRSVGIPCSADPKITDVQLFAQNHQMDTTLMNAVIRMVRLAFLNDGSNTSDRKGNEVGQRQYFISVRDSSGGYLTMLVWRGDYSRNERLGRFLQLLADFHKHMNSFNRRSYADYLNKVQFLIREYETGIPSPVFH